MQACWMGLNGTSGREGREGGAQCTGEATARSNGLQNRWRRLRRLPGAWRMARTAPVTVVETPEFLAAAAKLMDEAERMRLVDPRPQPRGGRPRSGNRRCPEAALGARWSRQAAQGAGDLFLPRSRHAAVCLTATPRKPARRPQPARPQRLRAPHRPAGRGLQEKKEMSKVAAASGGP